MNLLQLIRFADEVPAEGTVTAGTIGGVFFVLLGVACYLLWRNLDQRLKRMEARERALAEPPTDTEPGES